MRTLTEIATATGHDPGDVLTVASQLDEHGWEGLAGSAPSGLRIALTSGEGEDQLVRPEDELELIRALGPPPDMAIDEGITDVVHSPRADEIDRVMRQARHLSYEQPVAVVYWADDGADSGWVRRVYKNGEVRDEQAI